MEGEKNQLDRKKTKDAWKHTKTKNKQRKTHARARAHTHTHTTRQHTHGKTHKHKQNRLAREKAEGKTVHLSLWHAQ